MDPQLRNFVLQLGDNALILGHRISEWCGHGPELEQDIALTNIALDLVGQARLYYQFLGEKEGKTEDDYAYLRKEREYRNVLLVEHPNTDFAYTIVRSFFFDAFHHLLLEELKSIKLVPLQNIAKQATKEVSYHLKYSKDWMIRLGDGTEISHQKIQTALLELWKYSGEFFIPSDADHYVSSTFGINWNKLESKWMELVKETIEEATLKLPENDVYMHRGGKNGLHTEAMGFILSDLQYMQRAYPNMQW